MLVFLSACSAKNEPHVQKEGEDGQEKKQIKNEVQQMLVEESTFRYVVDWLSNDEILFVDQKGSDYFLRTFHIYSKEIKDVYVSDMIIIDVLLHPTKEYLLIQTSDSATSATVKMLTLDGIVLNELTIESRELAIEWNDLDPTSILLTAFYEDWSFDTFLYDGETNQIDLLPIKTPLPKWLGTDHFAVMNDLDEGKKEVMIYEVATGEQQVLDGGEILSFDTFKKALFIVQMTEDEGVAYRILNTVLEEVASWTDGTINEYSDWSVPKFEWITEESLFALRAENKTSSSYELVEYENHDWEVVIGDLEDAALVCSPNHQKCLTGYRLEKLLDLKNKNIQDWLVYTED